MLQFQRSRMSTFCVCWCFHLNFPLMACFMFITWSIRVTKCSPSERKNEMRPTIFKVMFVAAGWMVHDCLVWFKATLLSVSFYICLHLPSDAVCLNYLWRDDKSKRIVLPTKSLINICLPFSCKRRKTQTVYRRSSVQCFFSTQYVMLCYCEDIRHLSKVVAGISNKIKLVCRDKNSLNGAWNYLKLFLFSALW